MRFMSTFFHGSRSLAGGLLVGLVFGATFLFGVGGVGMARPASAAPPSTPSVSLCLNSTGNFVRCDELPAGTGSHIPVIGPSAKSGSKASSSSAGRASTATSFLHGSGAKAAAGVVGFGIVLGSASLVIGRRRHKKGPRWDDRTDYRAA
jgi:hypothetical protein